MDRKIFFTNAALTDLEAILEWSLTKHTATTPTFLGSLMVHIYQLRYYPFAGGESDRRTGTRTLIHSPFLIYYRIRPKLQRIDILHVWHGRRRSPYS